MSQPAHNAIIASMLIATVEFSFSIAYAQDLQTQRAALLMITKTANEICQSAPLEAASQGVNLSGNATAKLGGLIGKVADLGITGAGEYQTNRSMGVLQKDLITAIQSGNDCKLEVFRTLEKKLLSGASAPRGNSDMSPPGTAVLPNPSTASVSPVTSDGAVGRAMSSHAGLDKPSFNIQPGPGEPARLIARELELQFRQGGFILDAHRPTITYDVEAEGRTVGRSLDGPDQVVVTVSKYWTDPTVTTPAPPIQGKYEWWNPNSSARKVAEELYRSLLPSMRSLAVP